MKNNSGNFKLITGLLAGMVIGGATVVCANQAIQAMQNDKIKVKLNGEIQTFKDETTGAIQYPITYDNRTYLPLRNVAQLAGLDVDYDADTNTALLTTKDYKPENNDNNPIDTKQEIINLLKDYYWTHDNVCMKKTCFGEPFEDEQQLTYEFLRDDLAIVQAFGYYEDFGLQIFLIGFKDGKVQVVPFPADSPRHPGHSTFGINTENLILVEYYGHMEITKYTAYKIENLSFNQIDEINFYSTEEYDQTKLDNFAKKYNTHFINKSLTFTDTYELYSNEKGAIPTFLYIENITDMYIVVRSKDYKDQLLLLRGTYEVNGKKYICSIDEASVISENKTIPLGGKLEFEYINERDYDYHSSYDWEMLISDWHFDMKESENPYWYSYFKNEFVTPGYAFCPAQI